MRYRLVISHDAVRSTLIRHNVPLESINVLDPSCHGSVVGARGDTSNRIEGTCGATSHVQQSVNGRRDTNKAHVSLTCILSRENWRS